MLARIILADISWKTSSNDIGKKNLVGVDKNIPQIVIYRKTLINVNRKYP